ncbi:hypothetical protein ASE22_25605 [Sphingomonas sp. Root720]|nr:hypothetical protein ASE22_25605 [Sphingomonas sp. Root720]
MERTARRAPEVVVRITGRQHGGGHVLANFSYISRLGHGADKELALYTSDGDVIRDGRDMQILSQDWHEWEMGDDARRKGATSLSMILSMPTGTDPERLREAALDFAREEFANRSWVASLHVDRDHPHVHLTVARRDHDGRRFHPNRDDLFRYRQRFATKLRDRGIEANATPAKARGIDPKHEPIAAHKVREKGGVPRIDKTRADRAARYGEAGLPDPVEKILARQHATVRDAYERSIAELSASPSLVDQAIVNSLERFVTSMPAPEPNSVRAARTTRETRDGADRGSAPEHGARNAPKEPDPLGAALARSRAMREQLDAKRVAPEAPGRSQPEGEGDRPAGMSDRLRSLMDEAAKQSSEAGPNKADDILRKTQERDRAQRDRDRPPDKGGPRR